MNHAPNPNITKIALDKVVAKPGDTVTLIPGVKKQTRQDTGTVKCVKKSISSDAMLYLITFNRSHGTESVFVHSNEIAVNETTGANYQAGDPAPDECNNLEMLCL